MELIEIRINGAPRQVPGNQPLTSLLDHLEIASERVAIELNRTIVRKRDWPATIVPPDAQLEIVEFVGGG
ncbi:MAG TPA: sulfur carrier protein ThiS [Bryobacteraceae bacterium]|nr:sulfur carrier protein ThiS [Bryobacteraceae bacterium]